MYMLLQKCVFRVTHFVSFLSLADKVLIVLAEWAILLNYKQVSEECVLVPKPKALGSVLNAPLTPQKKQTLNDTNGGVAEYVLPPAGRERK